MARSSKPSSNASSSKLSSSSSSTSKRPAKKASSSSSAKKKPTTATSSFKRKRGSASGKAVHEIVFDPEARKAYLQGFSERKKQRRAYGLAMQKLKDRQAKLEERREKKKAQLEELKQLEQQKEAELMMRDDEDGGESERERDTQQLTEEGVAEPEIPQETTVAPSTIMTKYEDIQTKKQWGGQVIVTTSTLPVDDDGDDDDDDDDNYEEDECEEIYATANKQPPQQLLHSVDKRQKYAGSVEKYLNQVKSNMPSKRKAKQQKQQQSQHRKGRHGAAAMKGMGGEPNLKLAQKALSKALGKSKTPRGKLASTVTGSKHSKKHNKR